MVFLVSTNEDLFQLFLRSGPLEQLAVVCLALLMPLWKISRLGPAPSPRMMVVRILTGDGAPAWVVVMGPQACIHQTNRLGLARVPMSWVGALVSIHHAGDHRELCRGRLPEPIDGQVRIELTPTAEQGGAPWTIS